MKDALIAENICKRYGKGSTSVIALNDVSLTLRKGEIVALLGPSGAGKSTLLTTLGLIRPPDSGRITIGGQAVFENGYRINPTSFRRKHLGFVFQRANLLPFLTAEENVRLPMEHDGVSSRISTARARELIESFGLTDRRSNLPCELSGGQQQRVAIARALANRPELLFADEPTAALDSSLGRLVMEMLRDVAHKHQNAVLVVTHDTRAIDVFDRVLKMEDGCICSQEATKSQ
ncbi:MAG: ABC transporter ATP-binding protein [Kiritimatiellae bacterium]|nr:ABC transporter ATP-binding protein [Kiritimatiellia bacterium]